MSLNALTTTINTYIIIFNPHLAFAELFFVWILSTTDIFLL